MANHVHTSVTFHRINDEGKAVLQELYSRVRKDESYEWFSDIYVDGQDGSPTYEEAGKYEFTYEHVGPKWCYFEEFDDTYFTMESAWSWPEIGVEYIFDRVAEVDPNFIAYVTYEDEMPNFAGVYVYDKDGVVDGYEDDEDEIRDLLLNTVDGLMDEWDREEQEFTEEGEEMFQDNLWEEISNAQMELVHETISQMEQDEAEAV
jgi:hypothetical protein